MLFSFHIFMFFLYIFLFVLFFVFFFLLFFYVFFFFFKQKTEYVLLISDWISDVCASDLTGRARNAFCGIPLHKKPMEQPSLAAFGSADVPVDGGADAVEGLAASAYNRENL